MKKITAIEAQKRHPDRVNVYLDGEFAFGAARVVAAWLRTGQTLDPDQVARLQAEDAFERAYQQAMLFLSFRARSEAEIRQNLRKHEYAEPAIDAVLERLRQDRLADDGQFARTWVENRSAFRPRSRTLVSLELRRKGLADEDIRSATAGMDDEALAYAAAQKRASRLQGLEWIDFRRKLSEFLARRGFGYAVITPTVKRLWSEGHAGKEPSLENEEHL
jgi:regulatory protein